MSSSRLQTYLLPSLPFRRRTSSSASSSSSFSGPTSPPSDTTPIAPFSAVNTPQLDTIEERSYLSGARSSISCSGCHAHLALTSQIVSKGFTGRHGRAYLVAPDVPSTLPLSTAGLPNTIILKAVPRHLVTGLHTVCDVQCICGNTLGWKYLAAEEEAQQYKIGKFILESRRTVVGSCWENEDQSHPLSAVADDDIVFDSQNEEECEELFAGVWTPQSARRKRARKLARA